jgi:hypothetical protein
VESFEKSTRKKTDIKRKFKKRGRFSSCVEAGKIMCEKGIAAVLNLISSCF